MLNYQFFRSRPTYMYRLDPSRIFGNTFTSRKTTNTARLGLCVMSAQAGLLPLPVQLQLCGDMYNAFTPLRSPTGLSNHAELSINFPQTSDLYIPLRSKSDIWKYFKLKEDDKDHKRWAVCNECPDKSLAFSGTTTTLWNHVHRVHFIAKPTKSK